MITLGTVTLSDNMTLTGVVQSSSVVYEQKISLEGYSNTAVYPKIGGRPLTMGSSTDGGSTMGVWCSSAIDEVKALEASRSPQALNYHGDPYTVLIVDTSDFTPLFKWEPEGPNKKYTGNIKMIEA